MNAKASTVTETTETTAPEGASFVSEKATEAVARAAKVAWTESLEGWELRSSVDDVAASWGRKVPTVHDHSGTCLKGYTGETRDREWLGQAFDANRVLGSQGKPRTYGFCTRCVVTRTAEAKAANSKTKATLPEPAAVVAAEEAWAAGDPMPEIEIEPTPEREDGERLNAEAAELAVTLDEVKAEMLDDSTASDAEIEETVIDLGAFIDSAQAEDAAPIEQPADVEPHVKAATVRRRRAPRKTTGK
jgi:hypothetical protein